MASESGSTNALKVPVKLLHVNETQYTTKWSQQTYSYYHMFDHGVTLAVPREGNLGTYDLKKWKDKAVALTYNIKNKGLLAGRTEMVRIANEEYGLTVPGRNSFDNKCKDIDDIFCVIGDKNWYYNDLEYSRSVIYHLLYLIARPGYNSWLLSAEKNWMKEYGIVYEQTELDGTKKSKAKGFVYTIMHSTFANTTQKAFRKKLLFLYQEFITVRNRKKFSESNEYTFTPCVFKNTYKGYIVTPKVIIPTIKTVPDILRNGKQWVHDCQEHQMGIDEIVRLVQDFFNKKKVTNVNVFHSDDDNSNHLFKEHKSNKSEHCLSSQSKSIFLNIFLNYREIFYSTYIH